MGYIRRAKSADETTIIKNKGGLILIAGIVLIIKRTLTLQLGEIY